MDKWCGGEYDKANKSEGVNDMLRAINDGTTHRAPVMQAHRARPVANPPETKREGEPTMESYRNGIIAMLDMVQDARIMRTAYEMLKALFENTAFEQKR